MAKGKQRGERVGSMLVRASEADLDKGDVERVNPEGWVKLVRASEADLGRGNVGGGEGRVKARASKPGRPG